jgi:hypothetical protein
MVSATIQWFQRACLPPVVSLFLLEALFMQISGVSLALTWTRRLCSSDFSVREPVLQAFTFPSTGKGDTAAVFSGLCVYL